LAFFIKLSRIVNSYDKTLDWNYSELAKTYDKRPDYATAAMDALMALCAPSVEAYAADMGAGTGKLTRMLCDRGYRVTAIEPNLAMRKLGINNTEGLPCRWKDSTAEATGLPTASYDLVSFGSSFNVVDRHLALLESARLLREGGWFVCMWNHRDLTDPLQAAIEEKIHRLAPGYQYGIRREDQSAVIASSGLFDCVLPIDARFVQPMHTRTIIDAWRSHGTLARHAGERFSTVIDAIANLIGDNEEILVPYHTRMWCAQRKGQ
jgi:SAM-dependent methyltransferase